MFAAFSYRSVEGTRNRPKPSVLLWYNSFRSIRHTPFHEPHSSSILYGCEIWSLTLREEHRLGIFENRILRRIFGPKRGWRKLHNEELHNWYYSPSVIGMIQSRRIGWVGNVARMGGEDECI
jgi:hypothetical protein